MNPTDLNSVQKESVTLVSKSSDKNSTLSNIKGNTINVSATYSYLSVLTSEQHKLSDEMAQSQATLQRYIASLASEPERAENANPTPKEKPLLDLISKVVLRDENLQEKIASDLTSRIKVVKTSDSVTELQSYCDTLPKIFQESNDVGKALMRYLCEVVVNLSTSDNISPATTRQLAKENIFPPDGVLTPKGEQVLSKLLSSTIEFIRANQPDVLAVIGKGASEVIVPSVAKMQMADFIQTALDEMPEEDTYLNLFTKNSQNFEDETSAEIAKRVSELINKAATIARDGHLLTSSRDLINQDSQNQQNLETDNALKTLAKVIHEQEVNKLAQSLNENNIPDNNLSKDANLLREAIAKNVAESMDKEIPNNGTGVPSDIDLVNEYEHFEFNDDKNQLSGNTNKELTNEDQITKMLSSVAAKTVQSGLFDKISQQINQLSVSSNTEEETLPQQLDKEVEEEVENVNVPKQLDAVYNWSKALLSDTDENVQSQGDVQLSSEALDKELQEIFKQADELKDEELVKIDNNNEVIDVDDVDLDIHSENTMPNIKVVDSQIDTPLSTSNVNTDVDDVSDIISTKPQKFDIPLNNEELIIKEAKKELLNPTTENEELLTPSDKNIADNKIEEGVKETVINPVKKGFFSKITNFFTSKTNSNQEPVQNATVNQNGEINELKNSPQPELTAKNIEYKTVSMDEMVNTLSTIMSDGTINPEVRKMADSIHQAMTNPLGDLQAVSEWLGLISAPLSSTGARAKSMQQWALLLLSIRFRQLGKNIDKFSKTEPFKQILKEMSLGDQHSWSKNALNQTLQQIERMQQLSSKQDPDFGTLPFIPLPPSYEGGREGGLNVEHSDPNDGEIEWRLNFFFELPNLGPLQVRTSLKMPDVKLNVVTERLEALQKVKETSDILVERLTEYGFTVVPITARIGTIYPPTPKTENKSTVQYTDGLSVNI
ncbi:MAG: flagellar hook-length control protein FliK [Succinivibrionaceae bacterium]